MPGANPHLEHLIVQKMRFPVPGPTHRLEFAVGEFVKVTVAPSVLATISGLIGSKPPQRHVLSQCGASFKCCPSHLTYEHHSNFAQAYSRMEDALSTINASHPSVTTTWHYFSSLWSALKFNFAEWQCRAVSRRSTRIAADIEASTFRWD